MIHIYKYMWASLHVLAYHAIIVNQHAFYSQLLNTTKIYGVAVLHLIHDCMQVLKMEWQLDGIIYIQLCRPQHPENYSIQLKWNPRNTILPRRYAKCCLCQMLEAKQAKITQQKWRKWSRKSPLSPQVTPPPPPPPPKKKEEEEEEEKKAVSFLLFFLFF